MSDNPVTAGKLPELLAEYSDVERQLSDPAVHADQARARTLGRRFAVLSPIVAAANELQSATDDLGTARELASEDASFAAEAESLQVRIGELEGRLRELLLPRDPNDGKDVILEVKAGEGGDESALFAGDLLRMYTRYAERQGWVTEVLDLEPTDLGGIKSATLAVRARGVDNPVWSRLKFEGGVHRVQRVPATESQGRIHTSAGRRACDAGGRGHRRRDRPERVADRRFPFRPGRVGRASTPPTRPSGSPTCRPGSSFRCRTRRVSCRTGRGRPAGAAGTSAGRGAGRRRTRPPPTCAAPRPAHRGPLRAGADVQLPGEPRISDHRVGFKAYKTSTRGPRRGPR